MKTAAHLSMVSALMLVPLAGCSSAPSLLTQNVSVPYERSSAFSRLGFDETALAEDRYRIVVGGRLATPKARMEKVATVRAAEIGVEQKFRYFKIDSMSYSEKCSPATKAGAKSPGSDEIRTSLLTVEVTYSKAPLAGFFDSKQSFEQLRPTLDTEAVVAEPVTAPPTPCT